MFQNIKRTYLLKLRSAIIIVSFALLLFVIGCNTRVEGCLDIAAANFDLDADRDCDGCCTYPTISISLSQKWNDRNFSTTDTLVDVQGDMFKIVDLQYYLSSWLWSDVGSQHFTVDSADIACNGGLLRYTPDILVVETRQFVYTLGTMRTSPLIDSVHLVFGLHPSLDCVDASSSSTPAVLSDNVSLWDESLSSRATVRLVLQRDLANEIKDTLYIHTFQNLGLAYDLGLKPGINTTLNLTVNYALWFENADIQDLDSFEASILSGIKGSIFKTP